MANASASRGGGRLLANVLTDKAHNGVDELGHLNSGPGGRKFLPRLGHVSGVGREGGPVSVRVRRSSTSFSTSKSISRWTTKLKTIHAAAYSPRPPPCSMRIRSLVLAMCRPLHLRMPCLMSMRLLKTRERRSSTVGIAPVSSQRWDQV